jgi:hypothetical protein
MAQAYKGQDFHEGLLDIVFITMLSTCNRDLRNIPMTLSLMTAKLNSISGLMLETLIL